MNFFKSPITKMVEGATSELNIGADRAKNQEICAYINEQPDSAKDAVKCIRKRLKDKNPKVAVLSLHVLDALMRECGHKIYEQVGSKETMADLDKLVRSKSTDVHLADKMLALIQLWGVAFAGSREYPIFGQVYDNLISSGIRFPEPCEEPFQPVPPRRRRAANPQRAREMDLAAAAAVDFDLDVLRNNVNLLAELISFADPKEDPTTNDLMQEMVINCQDASPALQARIGNTSDDATMMQLLALNDELQRVLADYDRLASGEAAVEAVTAEEYQQAPNPTPAGSAVTAPVAQPSSSTLLGAAPVGEDGFHQAPVSLDNVDLLGIFGGTPAAAQVQTQQARNPTPLSAPTPQQPASVGSPPANALQPPPAAKRSRVGTGGSDVAPNSVGSPPGPGTSAGSGSVDLLGLDFGAASISQPPPSNSSQSQSSNQQALATPDDFDDFLNSRVAAST